MNRNLSTLAADLEADGTRLANEVATLATDVADRMHAAGERSLTRAQGALSHAGAAVRSSTRQVSGATGDYVKAHPWRALAVVAVVGLLAGAVVARR